MLILNLQQESTICISASATTTEMLISCISTQMVNPAARDKPILAPSHKNIRPLTATDQILFPIQFYCYLWQDLSAQRISSRHWSLLPTQDLLQSSQHRIPSGTEGPLSAQGPPLGGTGPPLSGTKASSRHRGLPQSPQHRGVGPFGIVSLLPTQGPPPILSAQTTFRHRGPPLGTGASSQRHRDLL